MHPIEHLRHLARAESADAAMLVAETATALGGLRNDPASLVVATRRIIERHPTVGPLWWLCSHVLVAADPRRRAWELADELAADPTATELAEAVPAGATVLVGGAGPVLLAGLAERGDVAVLAHVAGEDSRRLVLRLRRAGVAVDEIGAGDLAAAAATARLVIVGAVAADDHCVLGRAEAAAVCRAGAAAHLPVWLLSPLGTTLPSRYVDAIRGADPQLIELDLGVIARRLGPSRSAVPLAPELLRAVPAR